MRELLALLRRNQNYRRLWYGQMVSDIGDHFNNIAVFSLAMQGAAGGLVVTTVLLCRGLPMLFAGPVAGIVLDRLDRRRVMIASDLVRALVAALFVFCPGRADNTLLYALSALLMSASPFFTSGRAAILPSVAPGDDLRPANTITQMSSYLNTSLGALLGGMAVHYFGFTASFLLNAASFLVSAWCLSRMRAPVDGWRAAQRTDRISARDYVDGLRYLQAHPFVLSQVLVSMGWALGGGTAQVLFSIFGEQVFQRGPQGIGQLWGAAGFGLVLGGMVAHRWGPRISWPGYLSVIWIAYLVHGLSYVAFAWMENFWLACVFVGLSRAAVGTTSVLNAPRLLAATDNAFRGRVMATMDTTTWSTMMLSMLAAGYGSQFLSPRGVAAAAGVLSTANTFFWLWARRRGWLQQPLALAESRSLS
jgi:hypothetical protein